MLLSITNTAPAATDLGFLLHKNPANLHSVELSVGKAHVFYSEANEQRCTACLLLDIDSVDLVRGGQQLDDYVNDRPYVASSYFTVAIGRVFGTALAGNCQRRPDLVVAPLPLEVSIAVIRARGGAEDFAKIFLPLGYKVESTPIPLDPHFPDWGMSPYFQLNLRIAATVHDLLSHLYVLLPVLDNEKHYYINENEVDKLLRHGEGWLQTHPERNFIVNRYLKRKPSLIQEAFNRLVEHDGTSIEAEESKSERAADQEKNLERPITLHTQRLILVATRLRELGAKTILDLGCGEGKLLRRLLADRSFERIVGVDISYRTLTQAATKLRLERMSERERARIQIRQGSLVYRDRQLSGFDAAALVEVIEHLDLYRLQALERVLFEFARPRHVIVTTPNREYNALFPTLPEGQFRHGDHRFEWTRAEFSDWASGNATRFGYQVHFEPVGPFDETHGAPSQMAIFSLEAKA